MKINIYNKKTSFAFFNKYIDLKYDILMSCNKPSPPILSVFQNLFPCLSSSHHPSTKKKKEKKIHYILVNTHKRDMCFIPFLIFSLIGQTICVAHLHVNIKEDFLDMFNTKCPFKGTVVPPPQTKFESKYRKTNVSNKKLLVI